METVIFPDAKAAVITYLSETLTVPVSSRIPNTRPDDFIRILHAGGAGAVNPALDDVAFTVESWSTNEGGAADRAQLVRAHLRNATVMGGHGVYAYTEWGPPVDLPDESGQYRYTFTFTIRIRGHAA